MTRDSTDSRISPLSIGYAGRIAPKITAQRALDGALCEPLFCASCGCFGGFVTQALPDRMFWACEADNGCGHDCSGRFDAMTDVHQVPDPDGYRGV